MALAIRGVRVRRRVSEVLAVASVAVGIAAGPAPAVDRVSAPGDIAWVARHDQGSAFNESASVVVASPAGARIFETGIDYTSNFTYVTVANDAATGSELWSATYDAGYVSSKVSLAVSPDGAVVYLAGPYFNGLGQSEADTVAYDASTGQQLWVNRYSGPTQRAEMDGLAVSPDGTTLFETGSAWNGTNDDLVTLAIDAATGVRRWVNRLPGPGQEYLRGQAVAVSSAGDLVFAAAIRQPDPNPIDYVIVAHDAATGARRWVAKYDAPGDDPGYPVAIALSPDDRRVFVTGWSSGSQGAMGFGTVALRADTGVQIWSDTFGSSGSPDDLSVSPDGQTVVVVGALVPGGFTTVAYDAATGDRRWSDSLEQGWAKSTVVSLVSGTAFVSGWSTGAGEQSFQTVAYAVSSGATLWWRRFGASPCSYGNDVALAPDGSLLYVTGKIPDLVEGCGSEFSAGDYGTVAYRTT